MTEAMATLADWSRAAAVVTIEPGLFIDGKFRPSATGETFAAVNPATGNITAQMACGSAADIDAAVAAAVPVAESLEIVELDAVTDDEPTPKG